MQQVTVDRRTSNRRSERQDGRRATDQPARSTATPVCPSCRQSATIPAGEAEGGWWFVCDSCDHLWDQRSAGIEVMSELAVTAANTDARSESRASWFSSAAGSWWRMALGRTS